MTRAWTRLIRFTARGSGTKVWLGQPVDPTIDVGRAFAAKQPIEAYIISGNSALDPKAAVTPAILTVDKLLTPLSLEEIPIVRALGLNYIDHAEEVAHLAGRGKADIPTFPILFYKPTTALIPTGEPIQLPKVVSPVHEHLPDYEVELVIVIGKDAKNVTEADALDYVLGYTGANDVSFRKWQTVIPQWGFSKSFDNSNPFGPVLVRGIQDPQNIPLKSILNGKTVQNGNTKHQIFNVRKIISFLSQSTTLQAGTIIMTGTPAGVGFVRKPKLWLKPGDIIECELGGGIGTLVNTIKEEGNVVHKAKL